MRRVGHLSTPLTLALAVVAVSARAEEILTVQLEPTMDSARRDAAEQMLKEEYPRYRSLWESQRNNVESYVISRNAALRFDMPCDGVPIRIAVRNGIVTTATYTETAGKCVAGQVVEPPEYSWPIPSPDELFEWLFELGSPPSTSKVYGCLLASFDRTTGIPTKIDAGCPSHIDDFLTIEVSDIRTAK